MPAQPSYYDSIGLLAICDAIDTVDGIPFFPKNPPRSVPEVHRSTAVVPAFTNVVHNKPPTQPTHTFLSHIPVIGMLSPVGSIPYEEEQRVALNELSISGQLPSVTPQHTIGGVRPNIPVAHNLHAKNSSRSSAAYPNSAVPPSVKSLQNSQNNQNMQVNRNNSTGSSIPNLQSLQSLQTLQNLQNSQGLQNLPSPQNPPNRSLSNHNVPNLNLQGRNLSNSGLPSHIPVPNRIQSGQPGTPGLGGAPTGVSGHPGQPGQPSASLHSAVNGMPPLPSSLRAAVAASSMQALQSVRTTGPGDHEMTDLGQPNIPYGQSRGQIPPRVPVLNQQNQQLQQGQQGQQPQSQPQLQQPHPQPQNLPLHTPQLHNQQLPQQAYPLHAQQNQDNMANGIRQLSPEVNAALNSLPLGPQSNQTPNMPPVAAGMHSNGMLIDPNTPVSHSPVMMESPSFSNGGSPSPGSDLTMLGSEYTVESCQICGRAFKGAKAGTHKQQHIRRLHPTEYIPKRGGKRPRSD